jgi:hypothetical protein
MRKSARDKLNRYFASAKNRRVYLSIDEIEEIAGELPRAARDKAEWWENNPKKLVAQCWMNNGYKTGHIKNIAKEKCVVFSREPRRQWKIMVVLGIILILSMPFYILANLAFDTVFPSVEVSLQAKVTPVTASNDNDYVHHESSFDSFSFTKESVALDFYVEASSDDPYSVSVNSASAKVPLNNGFVDIDISEPNKYLVSTEFSALETVEITFYSPMVCVVYPEYDGESFVHYGVPCKVVETEKGHKLTWEKPTYVDVFEGSYYIVKLPATDQTKFLASVAGKPEYALDEKELQQLSDYVELTNLGDAMILLDCVSGTTYDIKDYDNTYTYFVLAMNNSFGKTALSVSGNSEANKTYAGDASAYLKNQNSVPWFALYDDSKKTSGGIDFEISGQESSRGFRSLFLSTSEVRAEIPFATVSIVSHNPATKEDTVIETYEANQSISIEYWGDSFKWLGKDAKCLASAEMYWDEVAKDNPFATSMNGMSLAQTLDLSTTTAHSIKTIGSGEVELMRAEVSYASHFDNQPIEITSDFAQALAVTETTENGIATLIVSGNANDIKIGNISLKLGLLDYVKKNGLWFLIGLVLTTLFGLFITKVFAKIRHLLIIRFRKKT